MGKNEISRRGPASTTIPAISCARALRSPERTALIADLSCLAARCSFRDFAMTSSMSAAGMRETDPAGLTWLSTVPPTSALVAQMFGTRWFSTLYGFAFVSHQVGGFLGVLLGGIVFEKFGSYAPIWWLSVLFGVLSALINLPIVEAPVARPVAQRA